MKQRTQPADYDHLELHRGVLRTPDGDISVEKIGKGMFSVIYREVGGAGRVFAVSDDDVYDKEIISHARIEGNQHVPAVEKFGTTRDKTVYAMPYYRTPLRKSDSPEGWRDFTTIKKCHDDARKSLSFFDRTDPYEIGYPMNVATVDCAKRERVSPAVVEALESLVAEAANYGSTYALEFSPRNLATDEAGHLVLLDVLFDAEAVRKRRDAKLRAARGSPRS